MRAESQPDVQQNPDISNRVVDRAHSPIVFFDGVMTASHMNGIIGATLVAQCPVAMDGIIKVDVVPAVNIRASIPAAKELITHLVAAVADAEKSAALVEANALPRH